MIRLPVAAVLAVGLFWAGGDTAPAQSPKQPAAPAKQPAAPAATGLSPQTQKINELIAKGWESAGIKKPAAQATDLEFMRRVFIDLIGRIPTPEEILDFEADKTPNKRAKLVYRLLNEENHGLRDRFGKPVKSIAGLRATNGKLNYNDAYAENFAQLWTTWMLTRSNVHPIYRASFHAWLSGQFANGTSAETANGVPWNQIARKIIGATGKNTETGDKGSGAVIFVIRHLGDPIVVERGEKPNFGKDGKFDAVPVTSRVTKLFLGIQSQCVQCHDHPFNKEYLQSDFWGMNAFFRQTDRSGTTNPRNLGAGVTPPPLTLSDMGAWNTAGMVLYERRDGQRKASFPIMLKDLAQAQAGENSTKRLISGNVPSGLEGKTRRQILAHWVTEHDNFGRAFVNRMWGHLFGRGLNKEPTVDDFSSNNEVVHPELLDYLAEEFKKYNYDPKKLLEWICTSNAYNLSHFADKAYTDQKYDPFFARMPLKALSPNVMFDSLAVATHAETRHDDAAYRKLKTDWSAKLTQNFGDDEGNEINFNGTVVQALLMMNGREINGEIGGAKNAKNGVVADVVKKHLRGTSNRPIYDELFLMTIGRHVTAQEYHKLEEVRNGTTVTVGGSSTTTSKGPGKTPPKNPPKKGPRPTKGPAGTTSWIPGTGPDDVDFYQDVFWALLNCNEFMLNH